MKKLVLLVIALTAFSTMAQSQFGADALAQTLTSGSDVLFGMKVTTVDRQDYNFTNGTVNPNPGGNGEMNWLINITTGYGVITDSTGAISSLYEVEDAVYKEQIIRGGNKVIVISGIMTSNSGNRYTFVINDRYNMMSMMGPNIPFAVFRRYTNVKPFKTTVAQYKSVNN
jgi:hypothetical protein